MKRPGTAVLSEVEKDCAQQLARFFPDAVPVRISVQVTALRGGHSRLREPVLLEFASSAVAVFVSSLPLEFDDRVRLERDRKKRAADAVVVAVQYHEGRKAVAVRFTQGHCEWVTQS